SWATGWGSPTVGGLPSLSICVKIRPTLTTSASPGGGAKRWFRPFMRGGALRAFRSLHHKLSVCTSVWLNVSGRGTSCRFSAWRSRWLPATGQTTTEWLMVAGALTAVGIFLLRVLPSTIHKFSEALVYSLRTIAP